MIFWTKNITWKEAAERIPYPGTNPCEMQIA